MCLQNNQMLPFPPEILSLILGEVGLTELSTISPSNLRNLYPCSDCFNKKHSCTHLHQLELATAYNLRLVCSLWNQVICADYGHYKFWKPII